MKYRDVAESSTTKVAAGAEAIALLEAVERSHARDRARVMAGELDARALHFIPPEMARNSTIRLSAASMGKRR